MRTFHISYRFHHTSPPPSQKNFHTALNRALRHRSEKKRKKSDKTPTNFHLEKVVGVRMDSAWAGGKMEGMRKGVRVEGEVQLVRPTDKSILKKNRASFCYDLLIFLPPPPFSRSIFIRYSSLRGHISLGIVEHSFQFQVVVKFAFLFELYSPLPTFIFMLRNS